MNVCERSDEMNDLSGSAEGDQAANEQDPREGLPGAIDGGVVQHYARSVSRAVKNSLQGGTSG